jgi:hypothetical protein
MPVFKNRETAMEYGDKLADHLVSHFEKQYKKGETWFLVNDEFAKAGEVLSSWTLNINTAQVVIEMIEKKINDKIEQVIEVSGYVSAHAATRFYETADNSPLSFKSGIVDGVVEFSGSYNSTEKFESVKAGLEALLIHHCGV